MANFLIPLLIQAHMENFNVLKILVDRGVFVGTMYTYLFHTLQLTETNIIP